LTDASTASMAKTDNTRFSFFIFHLSFWRTRLSLTEMTSACKIFPAHLHQLAADYLPAQTDGRVCRISHASTRDVGPYRLPSLCRSARCGGLCESADWNAEEQDRLRRHHAVRIASVRHDQLDAADAPEQDQHHIV